MTFHGVGWCLHSQNALQSRDLWTSEGRQDSGPFQAVSVVCFWGPTHTALSTSASHVSPPGLLPGVLLDPSMSSRPFPPTGLARYPQQLKCHLSDARF